MTNEDLARKTAHTICANHSSSFEYRYEQILSCIQEAVKQKDEALAIPLEKHELDSLERMLIYNNISGAQYIEVLIKRG